MFTRLMVPLDGSPLAERALAPALQLTDRAQAELMLVRVAYPEQMVIPEPSVPGARGVAYPEQALAHAAQLARQYLASVQAAHAIPERLVWGKVIADDSQPPDVAADLVAAAAGAKTELIVMSSHGRSGLDRWLHGSVAERLLAEAPCPVLMLRTAGPIRHILLALDGSPLSEAAVGPTLSLAHGLGAEVTLLHVLTGDWPLGPLAEPPSYHFYAHNARVDIPLPPQKHEPRAQLMDQTRLAAEAYLQNLIHQHAAHEVALRSLVESGPPAEAILTHVEQHPIDVIAMATHGRRGLRRWLYGSVTEKVLRSARSSMFIVRPRATTRH